MTRSVDAQTELSSVCEAALPLVEQALLAVQLSPRDTALTERLVTTLETSSLSSSRRDAIVARLQEDQAISDAVRSALENSFGQDSPELREALWGSLDQTWSTLMDGDATAAFEGGSSQSVSQQAGTLVGTLTSTSSIGTLDSHMAREAISPAIQQFCRSIALLLYWEEEEEEEEGDWAGPELE
jgi:hypothetical protein